MSEIEQALMRMIELNRSSITELTKLDGITKKQIDLLLESIKTLETSVHIMAQFIQNNADNIQELKNLKTRSFSSN